MKLYLLSQGVHNGYDTWDSVVVAAENEETARKIHPAAAWEWTLKGLNHWTQGSGTWADKPEQVDVKYIGEAAPETEAGVILASFNAG